jgi:hypothetical protein
LIGSFRRKNENKGSIGKVQKAEKKTSKLAIEDLDADDDFKPEGTTKKNVNIFDRQIFQQLLVILCIYIYIPENTKERGCFVLYCSLHHRSTLFCKGWGYSLWLIDEKEGICKVGHRSKAFGFATKVER